MGDLHLHRIEERDRSTLGLLTLDGEKLCDTLERGPGPNRPQLDRIPAGTHTLHIRREGGYHARYLKRYGPDFHKGMVEVLVPDRTFILFHIGNYWRDSLGCILTGDGRFIDGDGELAIGKSRDTYKRVYPTLFAAAKSGGSIKVSED